MKLSQGEMNLMELIWENEPVRSGELVALASEKLGWKKSTMYTILKHLTEKGAASNEKSLVTAIVRREEQLAENSETVLGKGFGGSLPMFLTAFLKNRRLSGEEADELKKLIDSFTEGD